MVDAVVLTVSGHRGGLVTGEFMVQDSRKNVHSSLVEHHGLGSLVQGTSTFNVVTKL